MFAARLALKSAQCLPAVADGGRIPLRMAKRGMPSIPGTPSGHLHVLGAAFADEKVSAWHPWLGVKEPYTALAQLSGSESRAQ